MTEYRLIQIPRCDLCTLPFDEDSRCPRIFRTCGHTLCQECMEKFIARSLADGATACSCCICQKPQGPQKMVLAEFPKNFGVLDVIQTFLEETVCDHQSKTPADFICLTDRCPSRQQFCGICLYTVHGKCNRQLILRAAEFPRGVHSPPLGISTGHFAAQLASIYGEAESPVTLRLLATHLDELVQQETDHPHIPTLEQLLEDRQTFTASLDTQNRQVFLESKKRNLLTRMVGEFRAVVQSRPVELSPIDLLLKIPSLWEYLAKTKEHSGLIGLVLKFPDIAERCLDRSGEVTLRSSDLMATFYNSFRARYESARVLDDLQLHQTRLSAIGKKLSLDLETASTIFTGAKDLVTGLTEGLVNQLKRLRRRIPGVLVVSKSQIERLCQHLDDDMAAVARDLATNFSYWFLKPEDLEKFQAAITVLQETMGDLEIFDSGLLATPAATAPLYRFDKLAKRQLKSILLEGGSAEEFSQVCQAHTLYQGREDLGLEQTLFVMETIDPVMAEDLRRGLDPYYQMPEDNWLGLFQANGLAVQEDVELPEYLTPFRPHKIYELTADEVRTLTAQTADRASKLPEAQIQAQKLEVRVNDLTAAVADLDPKIKKTTDTIFHCQRAFPRADASSATLTSETGGASPAPNQHPGA